jgi:hypothetical protein
MTEILRFLAAHFGCLFAPEEDGPGRYKLVDSETVSSFGNAYVVVASDRLRLRFVRDRSQLFLEFQPSTEEADDSWYSTDVIYRLLTGERQDSAELTESYARFVCENLDEIEGRFAPNRRLETIERLKDLERRRAKELFG